ncbi:MAG TPA: hypothetical protein DEG42_06845 [Acholeplasmataceae bacterium]|nr:MAG: hypothetical protein A2Y43_03930 [Tenericutes bacterium GWA2_38_26]OHE31202.1 MAG: hypothetical protein A2084_01675 [Tenericutes bacterium GWC2_39_45]OHE31666.1 MAG: hypothetical protein A2009_01710 [Tenericutes bacterium GWD2_38_27]HBG32376.1 hypothetical protein [Acholeplasmataceae bacterium]HBY66070.1 hypothetical protein [Acholeplasmataceae bacterium]
MLKWVGRILYIIVISLLSLQIYSYAYYSKLQEYYMDHVEENLNDNEVYLNGINTLMGIDYYRESPILYSFSSTAGDYQFSVNVYAVGVNAKDLYYDGLMIFVNNVSIMKDSAVIEDPILKISVELDQSTLLVGEELSDTGSIYFDPSQPFAYYNVPVLFLFDADDYLKVPDEDAFAVIDRILVEYSDGEKDEDNALIFDDSALFIASRELISDAAYHKDTAFDINVEDYKLRDDFADQVPTDAEILTFGLNADHGDLDAYNWTVWKTMLIYVALVIVVTYLLFFHKMVREHFKTKNYIPRNNTGNTITVEPIFKDPDINQKDGR